MEPAFPDIGLVVIGRNEGERLRRCLTSAVDQAQRIVYVDSDSSDNSVALAQSFGVDIVELDRSQPLASPRSRNAGFEYLTQQYPDLKYIQFLDGDCELVEGWLGKAKATLDANPEAAVVCGRRRELFPDRSIYNKLCDIEWNTPIGEAKACGGDALMRPDAFKLVGGFNPTLIGGGEPELCVRLRQAGWKILRIDVEMSLHDADIQRFRQWWNRSRRCGHAFAEGAWLHGLSPQRHWLRETISNWVWGLIIPLTSLALLWPTQGLSLILLFLYPILFVRIFCRSHRLQQLQPQESALYAWFCLLIKLPMVLGQIQFIWNRLQGRHTKLVEYKSLVSS